MFTMRLRLLAFALAVSLGVSGTTVTNDTAVAADKTFDYVIVGAGLAGLTVGNKLSGRGHSVLIIEAGPDDSANPVIYNAEDRVFHGSVCNWLYPAYDEDGTVLSQAIDSGACIGGGTSINGMVWYRPTEAEINKLETLDNPGWNWETLEPYMTASEKNILPNAEQIAQGAGVDPAVHGYEGHINTSFPTPMRIPGAIELFKQSLPQAFPGLTIGNDLSNRTSVVSASTSWTIWYDDVTGKLRRSSAADGFLWAADQQRDCLTLLSSHKVAKVLFDEDLVATGVSFVPNDGSSAPANFSAYAAKGVILSAGSLASGPILERSGIGRKDILNAAGVDQLIDLPGVGSNLNDQPGTSSAALVAESYWNDTSIIDNRNLFGPEISLVNIDEIWGEEDATAYANDLTSPEILQSRAQALVDAGAAVNVDGAMAVLNVTIDLITTSRVPVAELLADSASSVVYLAFWPSMPLSRGHVHINSSDPLQPPIITPRLLVDTFDQDVAIAITRRSQEVFAAAPFADVVAVPYLEPSFGPNGTDAEFLAWYRNTTGPADHWIGSTAMMPRHLGGVVDPELRVYGTKNLRVIDAGILPFQLTAHTMSTLYAIASRAADIILAEG
ncbi:GMC oxidoreductase [Thozetella sp. PMI_491]|nr:GMC oxidoreductase [Thozetella sp. PMI_491]